MTQNENLIKIFEYALNQEQTGMSFFQASIQRMGMGAAVSAFKKLVQEEQKHIVFINRILNDLRKGTEIDLAVTREIVLAPSNYFDERASSEFLQQCVEGSMIPDVTVFNTAYLIEKDLSEFYQAMADKSAGKAKEALSMLASWERSHEMFFKQYRDKLSDVYSKMAWGG